MILAATVTIAEIERPRLLLFAARINLERQADGSCDPRLHPLPCAL